MGVGLSRIVSGVLAFASSVLALSAIHAQAQSRYPTKPLRMLVGFTLGGTTDVIGRLIAQKLSHLLGQSVRDLIALAKSRPGQLNFSSGGAGNSDRFVGELFTAMAGIDIVHVPYKGGPQAAVDVASGQVAMYFPGLSTAWLLTKIGKVRALAVTTATRSSFEPDLPTMSEAGLKGYEHVLWNSLFMPAGTSREIIARFNADVQKTLAIPDLRERFAAIGAEPVGSSPEQLGAMLKGEIEKCGRIVRAIGLRID